MCHGPMPAPKHTHREQPKNRPSLVFRILGQDYLVVGAVLQLGLRHAIDSFVPRVIASMLMREQIFQVNPTMRANHVERDLAVLEQSNEERSRHTKKINCPLD